jgi:beta-lactamase class D
MNQIKALPLAIWIIVSSLVALLTIGSFAPARSHSQVAQPVSISSKPQVVPTTTKIAQDIDLGQSFRELDVVGSILIYDQNNDRVYEHNPSRNSTAFPPASTFKIFNALVALETGVIQDDVAVLTWDGIKREIPVWNQDTNLRQAFKNSTVWFYQVLARKIGHERMQDFINQVGYGNRQIGTEEEIDQFWLGKSLQITPRQEIEFLQRLERGDLPFSQRTLDLVKDIMIVERTPDYVLRGKTGWVNNVGWFVGYLEQNDQVYFFATNIEMQDVSTAAKRIELTRRSLTALRLL